jgi:hypothetical protein
MSRYKVVSTWGGVAKDGSFYLQTADIQDTRNGMVYRDGAYRVVDARKDMKPAKLGKGGTVPFYGETAWSRGESLLRNLALTEWLER